MSDENIPLPFDASEENIGEFVRNVEGREQLEELYGTASLLAEYAQDEIKFREENGRVEP